MNSSDQFSQAMLDYGVTWHGVYAMRSGAILTSIMWGAAVVFIIDRRLDKAAYALVIASVLSFFGFMHSTGLGCGLNTMNFPYAVGYLISAVICFIIHKTQKKLMDVPRRYDYV